MTKAIVLACALLMLAMGQNGVRAQQEGVAPVPPGLVTVARLEAIIVATEADPAVDAEATGRLIALYRKALSNLQEMRDNRARAEAFAEATRDAPEQTRRIRERIAADQAAELSHALPVGVEMPLDQIPLDQIKAELKRQQAERDAADAQRTELERRQVYQQNRPAAIRQRLAAAGEEQEAIAAALQAELTGDTQSALMQARRWSLETRYVALSTEIRALDQELISLPMRLDLLAARSAEEANTYDRIDRRVEASRALVSAQREADATRANADTERMRRATVGMDPVLTGLAEQNAALTEALAAIVDQSDELDTEVQQAERLAARITANFERVQTAKAVGAPPLGLGELLLQHRAALPDFDLYVRRASAREREIASANLTRLRHLEEAEQLAYPTSESSPALGAALNLLDPAATATWKGLREQRRDLLERQVEAEADYLERQRKLQGAETRMLAAARTYDAFIKEQLFWLPVGTRTRLADLAKLPAQLRLMFAPETWSEPAGIFADQVAASPLFWLTLLLSAVLLWQRRALVAAIQAAATPLATPSTDRFAYTLRALLLSLTLAAPLPLLMGVSGWMLLDATASTELSLTLGAYLMRIAVFLYVWLLLRALFLPGGVAMAHFRWSEPDVRRLGWELRWVTWTVVPAFVVLRIALALDPASAGGMVARLALLSAAIALGLFFYRVLHPRHGLLRQQLQRADAGLLYRAYPLWFPLLIAFPILILVLIWNGYIYTTRILADSFAATLGMIVALILLHALGVRWLRLTSRRLAWQSARDRRRAAAAARERGSQGGETADLAPPADDELDLEAINEQSLELLRISIGVVAAIGLFLIWSQVFPALGILDAVTLWHSTTMVDGEERRLPISLADLGLALVYLGGALVLAKRLPALLNMILADRSQVDSGSRYAITTLTAYVTIAIGVLLAFNAIGAQWSQLQWLVAALGVGIGFGLQEIVANFISGIIILFERPIRVGDIVTVGDTDGVVTRIRIRATTIRNWDRKELLVPNKEFITGRLLNWSLSDQVTRLMVTVGVAYGTDVEQAHALMREAAEEHRLVLKEPVPILSFESFGDNALTLVLRAYSDDLDSRLATTTDLHKAINSKFRQAGISIAFPQRDLHLDTREPLRVSLQAPGADGSETGAARASGKDPLAGR